MLFVGCLTSQQQASVSQGRICSDKFTCCHTEIEVADQTFYLTQSQYTDTGPTSPSADPLTPGAWQGSHWSANFEVTGMTRPRKKIPAQAEFEPGTFRSRCGRLTTRPTRRLDTREVSTVAQREGEGGRGERGGVGDTTCKRSFVGTEGGERISLLGLGGLFLRGSGEGGGSDPYMPR